MASGVSFPLPASDLRAPSKGKLTPFQNRYRKPQLLPGRREYRVAHSRMLKGICLMQKRRQAMRTTLVSVLAVLAQWGILANAQPQAGALPAWPAATNGNFAHPPTKRLFFFMSDPKNIGRPAVFGRPSDLKNIVRPAVFGRPVQATGTGGFLWPHSFTDPVSQNLAHPTLKFPPTGLLPLESPPPQDLWFLRPKNSRPFFFSKP